MWDTSNVLWPFVETANNVFNWTTVDSMLAAMNANAVHSAQVALSRTPYFATKTGGYTDGAKCSYIAYASSGLVTGLSESGTTVTATSTFNPGVGVDIVMSGDLPVAYDGVFPVTASNSTSFQYTNTVSGLGVGTAFGNGCPGTGCVGITTNLTNAAPGQCDPPVDLNADGTGTDLYYRNWVAAYSSHVNAGPCPGSGCYTNTHAHVVDWECANEPDTYQFFSSKYGTYDQLARMCLDAYAILKGLSGWDLTLTAVNSSGVYTGTITNGASNYLVGQHYSVTGFTNTPNNATNACVTASTATTLTLKASNCSTALTTTTETHAGTANFVSRFTGETGPQIRATVTSVSLSGPVDPTATVLMGSYHGNSPAIGYGQCYLYCTGTCTNPGGSNSCHVGGAMYTDAINFHMKPGQNLESQMSTWITAIDATLQPPELAKPMYNTEGGYSAGGWTTPYTDTNLQASFIARYYPYSYSLGIANNVWYDWTTNGNAGLGSVNANTAFNQIGTWMLGSTMGTLTTSAPLGSNCPVGQTCFLYTYTLTLNTGGGPVNAAIMWDNSQTCTPCTTANVNLGSVGIPGSYLTYLTTLGGATKSPIVSHTVPVGIQPILVQAQ